jgi:hypothetical protein
MTKNSAASIRVGEIRKEANYAGIRLALTGTIDGARCPVQIDVGYGDAVTPAPESARFPVMFEDMPAPTLRVYPRYTVVAEKLEAIISLGMANSRMKDYFDLWVILREAQLEQSILAQAVEATLNRRGTRRPSGIPFVPSSACLRANAICSSVNLLFFTTCPLFHRVKNHAGFSTFQRLGFLGQGQEGVPFQNPVAASSVFSEKQGSQPLLGNSWLLDDHAA